MTRLLINKTYRQYSIIDFQIISKQSIIHFNYYKNQHFSKSQFIKFKLQTLMNQQQYFKTQYRGLSVSQVRQGFNPLTPNLKEKSVLYQSSHSQNHSLYSSQLHRALSPREPISNNRSLRSHIPPVRITYTNQSKEQIHSKQHFYTQPCQSSGLVHLMQNAKAQIKQIHGKIQQIKHNQQRSKQIIRQEDEGSPVNPLKVAVSPIYVKNLNQSTKPINFNHNQTEFHDVKTQMSQQDDWVQRKMKNSYNNSQNHVINSGVYERQNYALGTSSSLLDKVQSKQMYQSMYGPSNLNNSMIDSKYADIKLNKMDSQYDNLTKAKKELEKQRRKLNLQRSQMCIKQIQNQSIRKEVDRLRKRRVSLQTELEQKEMQIIKLQSQLRNKDFQKRTANQQNINMIQQISYKQQMLKSQQAKLQQKQKKLNEQRLQFSKQKQQIEHRERQLLGLESQKILAQSKQSQIKKNQMQLNKRIIQFENRQQKFRDYQSQNQKQLEVQTQKFSKQFEDKKYAYNEQLKFLENAKNSLQTKLTIYQTQLKIAKQQQANLKNSVSDLISKQQSLQNTLNQKNHKLQILKSKEMQQELSIQSNQEKTHKLIHQIQDMQRQHKALQETLSYLKQQNGVIERQLAERKLVKSSVDEQFKKLNQKNNNLSKQIEKNQMRMKQLQVDISEKQGSRTILQHQLKILQENKNKLNLQTQNKKKIQQQNSQGIKNLTVQKQNLQNDINFLKNQLQSLQSNKIQINNYIQQAQNRIKILNVPQLQSQKNSLQTLINQLKKQASDLQQNNSRLSKQATHIQILQSQQNIIKNQSTYSSTQSYKQSQGQIVRTNQQITQLQNQNHNMKTQMIKISKLLEQSQQINAQNEHMKSKLNRLQILEGQIQQLIAQNSSLNVQMNHLQSLKEQNHHLKAQNEKLLLLKSKIQGQYRALRTQFDIIKTKYAQTADIRKKLDILEVSNLQKTNTLAILKSQISKKNNEIVKFKTTLSRNQDAISKNLKNSQRIINEYKGLQNKYEQLLKKNSNQIINKQESIKIMDKVLSDFFMFLAQIHDANSEDYTKMIQYRQTLRKAQIKLPQVSTQHSWSPIFTGILQNHTNNLINLHKLTQNDPGYKKIEQTLIKLQSCYQQLKKNKNQ